MTGTDPSPPMTRPEKADGGAGMLRVTKAQFFATVGQMNVHPRVDVRTLSGGRSRSDWETPDRICRGVSFGHGEDAEYFVPAAIALANQGGRNG